MTELPAFTRDWVDGPVWDRFSAVRESAGTAVAVRDATGSATYDEIANLADRIAAAVDQEVPAGNAVAICVPAGRWFAAAVLAVLSMGRAYVPLDVSYPPERNQAILKHSGVSHVLVVGDDPSAFTDLDAATIELSLLPSTARETASGRAEDPAWVLYTSGSTGEPKGVWQDQRGLMHDVWQFVEALQVGSGDVISMVYSTSVVGAVRDLFGALLTGATVVTADLKSEGLQRTRARLREATILHAMPPILRTLLGAGVDEDVEVQMSALRAVYVAGDRFTGADLELLRRRVGGDCLIYTGIGATECSTLYRDWVISPDWAPEGDLVPVGRAVPERTMRLLDDHGAEVAAGEVGRIVVTSPFLAKGYWQRDDDARFGWDPDDSRQRRFDTGDLGRLRSDGLLEFLGRADRRAKIRGYLVEPAEVEAALRAEPEVVDAVVVPEESGAHQILVAYVEAPSRSVSHPGFGAELASRLRSRLPEHLVPQRTVVVDALPRLPNSKVDVARLADLTSVDRPIGPLESDPQEIEDLDLICKVWTDVMGQRVDAETRFADAGGDSLFALEIEVALENLGIVVPPGFMSAETRPLDLALAAQPLDDIEPELEGVLIVFPYVGDTWVAREVVARLRPVIKSEVAAYPLSRDEEAQGTALSIKELAEFAVADISARHPQGTLLYLVGLSFGARTAWEAAALLDAQGHKIAMVGIGDLRAVGARITPTLVADLIRHNASRRGAAELGRIAARSVRARLKERVRRASSVARRVVSGSPTVEGAPRAEGHRARRLKAAHTWRPSRLSLPVTVFASEIRARWEVHAALGWRDRADNCSLLKFAGGHRFQENLDGFVPVLVEEVRQRSQLQRECVSG